LIFISALRRFLCPQMWGNIVLMHGNVGFWLGKCVVSARKNMRPFANFCTERYVRENFYNCFSPKGCLLQFFVLKELREIFKSRKNLASL